jgi:uncharacterized protein YdaU (DUF1376 family)
MTEFPSLPLFTDAYLADTRHLTAQEHGAYLLLLMMAWRAPDCRLPDDDAKLAKWASVDARTWSRIKPTIMEFWTPESGTWTQRRLAREREYVSKRAEVARENGKHGGRPKRLKSQGSENPAGKLQVTQTKAPNPSPNPIAAAQHKGAAPPLLADRLFEAMGFPSNPPIWAANIGPITDLIAQGYDLESQILPVIRSKRKASISGWRYFVPIVIEEAQKRAAIPQAPMAPQIDWEARLEVFYGSDTWSPSWGPKPTERGCEAPKHLIRGQAA